MILYFDSYITDIPFNKKHVVANDSVRSKCKNYAMPRKVDIAKYTLASYSTYKWSNILIRYELDDKEEYKSFDEYVLKLFPKAVIMHERSDSQSDFKKSIEVMEKWNDQWIFYAGNNDHPIITPNPQILDELIKITNSFKEKYEFISIIYSHFSEFVNLPQKGSSFNDSYGQDVELVGENDFATVLLRKNGDNSAIQIVNKNLFKHWFDSANFGNDRVIRSEDVRKYFTTQNQLMIIPKQEICAHFDGYSYTLGWTMEIQPYQVPPLIIPQGFFENDIKIAYGYPDYREGWTNINPSARNYSFDDNVKGTDLKMTLDDLPLFWKDKISKIDINKNAKNLEKYARRNNRIISNPYSIFNKKLNYDTLLFILRPWIYKAKVVIRKIIKK